jgi:hypothetical protein
VVLVSLEVIGFKRDVNYYNANANTDIFDGLLFSSLSLYFFAFQKVLVEPQA